jgi:hypothetical protein
LANRTLQFYQRFAQNLFNILPDTLKIKSSYNNNL